MTGAAASAQVAPALGIIAGRGELPRLLITHCRHESRPFLVIAIEDAADRETLELAQEHAVCLRLGAVGEALRHLRAAGVREVTLAGHVPRPRLAALRPDAKGAQLLAHLGGSLFSGDNALLREVVSFFEAEGFAVRGVEEILQGLVAPEGALGTVLPDKRAQQDIMLGAQVARAIGALDIGQAVIVHQGVVLGVEAAEGTAALIARCAALRAEPSGGVLVKAKKPQQERRVDLPAIGVDTLAQLAQGGFSGVAIEAGASLVIGRREVTRQADALGLFVLGFSLAAAPAGD